jgi:hypothetical protein
MADDLAQVPRPARRAREWHEVALVVFVPTAVTWLLCLTSPGISLGLVQGAAIAAVFTLVWVPLMWLRVRN